MINPVSGDATLSSCRRYRYALWRLWDPRKAPVLFIGLNPSTANEKVDDPTLRRCIGFARLWGYGGVSMANLFAWRATDPRELLRVKNPVGAENDAWLQKLSRSAGLVVAAWGNQGVFLNRSSEVRSLLGPLHCLKINRSGEPAHPLYQRATTQVRPLN